jgi:hypothetical protein
MCTKQELMKNFSSTKYMYLSRKAISNHSLMTVTDIHKDSQEDKTCFIFILKKLLSNIAFFICFFFVRNLNFVTYFCTQIDSLVSNSVRNDNVIRKGCV